MGSNPIGALEMSHFLVFFEIANQSFLCYRTGIFFGCVVQWSTQGRLTYFNNYIERNMRIDPLMTQ